MTAVLDYGIGKEVGAGAAWQMQMKRVQNAIDQRFDMFVRVGLLGVCISE